MRRSITSGLSLLKHVPLTYIRPLLRHFDAIDRATTAGLLNKRPYLETTTTQLLCAMLDAKEQGPLEYTLGDLQRDLSAIGGSLTARFTVMTHEYNAAVENRVSQSDVGLIINYRDFITPSGSWTESWLLQAKSVKPVSISPRVRYTELSAFDALSADQLERMRTLVRMIGVDFVRLMHYCPRLRLLSPDVRSILIHLRDGALNSHIFDFALGLELRDRLLVSDPNLEPGIFVSSFGDPARSLADIYRGFFGSSVAGKLQAATVWDAIFLASAELIVRYEVGSVTGRPLHSMTMANALNYAFRTCSEPETRLRILLEAIHWGCEFYTVESGHGYLRDLRITAIPEVDSPAFRDRRGRRRFRTAPAQALGPSDAGPHQRRQGHGTDLRAGPQARTRHILSNRPPADVPQGARCPRLEVPGGGVRELRARQPGVAAAPARRLGARPPGPAHGGRVGVSASARGAAPPPLRFPSSSSQRRDRNTPNEESLSMKPVTFLFACAVLLATCHYEGAAAESRIKFRKNIEVNDGALQ